MFGDDAGQSSPRCGSPTNAVLAPAFIGSANTLVRTEHGWRADNTDVDGVAGALGDVRNLRRAVVLGSGGTAPAAIAALVWPGRHHDHRGGRNPGEGGPAGRPRFGKVGSPPPTSELGSPDLAAVVDRADVR